MYELPTSVSIQGHDFTIRNNGDYRMVIDCFIALEDAELSEQERIVSALIIFYDDINSIEDLDILPDINEAIKEMFKFFNVGKEDEPHGPNYKLLDWEQDSQMICSAVNSVARSEVRALPYLHWWTFMGYYMSVGESLLSTIVSIRSKILKGTNLEKYEQQVRAENPQYFTWNSKSAQQKSDEEFLMSLWNSGSK